MKLPLGNSTNTNRIFQIGITEVVKGNLCHHTYGNAVSLLTDRKPFI